MPKRSQKAARRYASKAGAGQKRQHPRRQLAAAPPPPSATAAKAAAPAPRPTVTTRAPAQPSQLASYQYLRGELRRIALLAGGIIVVLVVLAFVLG